MTPSLPTANSADPTTLRCLDVWGGNRPVDADLSVTGIDVSVRCRPWRDQAEGGDLYLVSMCACATISRFILADVAGHGDDAAGLTRRLRWLMSKHINRPDQTQMARALNEAFASLKAEGRFATALLLTYLPETDHLVVCNAGHPPPLWYRSGDATWQTLDMAAPPPEAKPADLDFPLGVLPGTTYRQCAVQLAPGDLIVLFSDGLLETPGADGRQLGMRGLRRLVAALDPDPSRLAGDILDGLSSSHGEPARDDQTVVVLSHNAADPPAQSVRQKLEVLARLIGVRVNRLGRKVVKASPACHRGVGSPG